MTPRSLRLSKDLSLPLDAVTQTFLVVGKRGSGKSNTAARLVEQFHHARLPFVVLDPVDTWWGLKASRDGGKGLDVYVFGGKHADLPLNAGDGALIAGVLCEHRVSMVLSVKHLSGRERSGFMVAFAQTLFQKWGGGPLHVVLEEAHELAPQMAAVRGGGTDGEAAMLGAFKRLWKLGRASGIGGTAVTQRPASLSKDITTQSEILVAHRTIGPQDVKAIGEWVKYHGERLDILAELPTLPTGEAFVWAPEFPEGKAIGLQRTSVLLRDTYDSASTPKVGEQRVEPKELAAVDLERLREKMAATIERAKADDPRELRKEIAELKKQLGSKVIPSGNKGVPVLTDADRALLEKVASALSERAAASRETISVADRTLDVAVQKAAAEYLNTVRKVGMDAALNVEQVLERVGFQKVLDKLSALSPQPSPHGFSRATQMPPRQAERTTPARHQVRPAGAASSGGSRVGGARPADGEGSIKLNRLAERKVLQVLVQHGERTKQQLAIQSGYAASGGGFNGALSKLKTAGLITSNGSAFAITSAGAAAIGDVEPLPTGSALVSYWMQQFNRLAEREVLRVVVEAYPNTITAEAIAARTNPPYEPKGGGFNGALSKLRTLGLIEGRGDLRASEELF